MRTTRTFALLAATVATSVVGAVLVAVPSAHATGVTPEWRQEAEAFTTKTVGAQFSDANASGGAAWNIWTNGHIQTSFTVGTTGAKQVDVVARGDVAAGVWPTMFVYVDGALVNEQSVASATYRTYSTTVSALTSGSHTVKVEFTNDATSGGEDRNLKVDAVAVLPSGVAQFNKEAELFDYKSTGQQFNDAAASAGKGWNVWANGYVEHTATLDTSGTKQIKVVARGSSLGGVWPNMRILVDGQILSNHTVGSVNWQTYTTTTTLSKGSHVLRVQFTNDASNGTEDRNLLLDVAFVVPVPNEWKQEAEAFTTKTAGLQTPSPLASGGQMWNLWSNGHLSTTMTAASAGRKTIEVIARGAPANGIYPIVKVYVDTTLVATQTIGTKTFTPFAFTASMTAGAHTLKVEYINNDTNLNGGDRNVHLDVATLIGDNAYPFVQGIPSPANNSYVGASPVLRATYADPDGDAGFVDFEVYTHPANALVSTGQSASTTAGGVASWTVTGAVNGQQYRWRARAYDGTSYAGSWTTDQFFTVDSDPPASPSVSSSTFPSGTWSGTDTTSGAFTFGPGGSADVVGYKYGLDTTPPRTDTTSTSVTLTPGEGKHTLYVQSVDRAGNLSEIAEYAFNVAGGAVTSPRSGDSAAQWFTLRSVANPTSTGVTYQWRRADTDAWSNIPVGDVTVQPGDVPVTAWPITMTGGVPSDLLWDVAATLGNVDGPVEVRASFSGGAGGTTRGTRVRLDRKNAAAATAPVGGGSVNLLTGNLTLPATDVSVEAFASDLTVTRTYNSRDPGAGASGPFGPGWVAGTSVDSASSGYGALTVAGTLRTVALLDGDAIGFTASGTNTFAPEEGLESLALTRTAGSGTPADQTDDVYELSDLDGNKTVFTWQSTTFLPTTVVQPGSNLTTTYTYETVGGVTRIARALAPVPAGVTCTSPLTTRGCRSIGFAYAPGETAIPGESGGDYPGRLRSVSLTAWDPAAGAMATVELARWSYLPSGRLLSAWDPRLPALKTTYAYDAAGHVTQVTPPGEEPFTFAYAAIQDDPDTGRLRSVSRSALAEGTATTTFVYDVPISGAGAATDLSSGQRARWGQTAVPRFATAVFPPNQTPDDNPATGTRPTSYERATVSYLDVTGRQVNTLSPGGHLGTVEYDDFGNAVRELAAGNRKLALDAMPSDTAAQEAALAGRLSTVRVFGADGQRLLEELGPEHEVALTAPVTDSIGRQWPAGALVKARARTVNAYDEGAPGGTGPYHLVTTSSTGARIADTTTDADVRTTTTAYDWTLRQPTTVTADPGGLNLVSRTSYDAATGLVTKSTLPGGTTAQDTAHTTVSSYYTAGTHPTYTECGNKPEWANQVCRTDPAAQPTVTTERPALPSKHFTYDVFNTVTTTTEKNGGTVLRTWTTQYDSAHRPWRSSVTATTGQALPTVETYYDPATGKATETRTLDGTGAITSQITRVYDSLGRLTSYSDADGNTATTTYDLLSRPVSSYDGKGTQWFHYDENGERRGLLNRVVDSAAGTFTATYDADGQLVTRTLPNGLVATTTRDASGTPVKLDYVKSGTVWLSFAVTESVHGQWTTSTSSGLSSQSYTYDAAGRLVKVADKPAGSGCNVREYTVDADSNRTSMVTTQSSSEGECGTGTSGTANYAYDAASRLTSAGYVYDALGRTTSVPAGDAGGKALTATYFVNDLVHSLTPQDGSVRTWALDPTQERFRSWTSDGVTKTNHYADGSDSPAWVAEGGTAWTRNIDGIGGDLAAVQDSVAGVALQLVNLHGDVVATASTDTGATAPTATFESAEFGAPRDEVARRYGWLGGKQRSADAAAGVVLMGVRLYNTATGRFLQVDPVAGGSDNPYDYAGHDPVNSFDLDGRKKCGGWRSWACKLGKVADYASYIPGPIGSGAALVSAGAYAAGGDYKNAGWAAMGVVPGGKFVAKGAKVALATRALSTANRYGGADKVKTGIFKGYNNQVWAKSERAAVQKGKTMARNNPSCTYRGKCKPNGRHVHVDYNGGRRRGGHTVHIRW